METQRHGLWSNHWCPGSGRSLITWCVSLILWIAKGEGGYIFIAASIESCKEEPTRDCLPVIQSPPQPAVRPFCSFQESPTLPWNFSLRRCVCVYVGSGVGWSRWSFYSSGWLGAHSVVEATQDIMCCLSMGIVSLSSPFPGFSLFSFLHPPSS